MADDPKKLCFVIGPIGDPATETRRHADWLLKGIIHPVFENHFQEFRVERSDQISAPGSISSQIINRLHTAELVIADMSRENANAFYEMGIRHMKRLPTIHMYSEGQKIPFDVQPYRAIPFKYMEPDDLDAARASLKSAVEEVIKPDFVVDNPVTQARGVEKLKETATPNEQLLFNQMRALEQRVSVLLPAIQSSLHRPVPDGPRTWQVEVLPAVDDREKLLDDLINEIRRITPLALIGGNIGRGNFGDIPVIKLAVRLEPGESWPQLLAAIQKVPGVGGTNSSPVGVWPAATWPAAAP